jgi:hypothetical protein
MVPISISQRVENNLQNCATITDDNTDRLAPVGIPQRVERKLRNCATITDGLRTSRSACMSEVWSVGTFTNRIIVGTFTDGLADRSKSLAGFSKKIGSNINSLLTEFNATDNNKCFVGNTVGKIAI